MSAGTVQKLSGVQQAVYGRHSADVNTCASQYVVDDVCKWMCVLGNYWGRHQERFSLFGIAEAQACVLENGGADQWLKRRQAGTGVT